MKPGPTYQQVTGETIIGAYIWCFAWLPPGSNPDEWNLSLVPLARLAP